MRRHLVPIENPGEFPPGAGSYFRGKEAFLSRQRSDHSGTYVTLRAGRAPEAVILEMSGQLTRNSVPGLCERAAKLLIDVDAQIVFCDVAGVTPDAAALDGIARLCLAAVREGRELRLVHVSPQLEELLSLSGFEVVVGSRG